MAGAIAFIAMTFMVMLPTCIVATDSGIFSTKGSLTTNITFPVNESVSTLLFWTEFQDAKVNLQIFTKIRYNVSIDVTQTGIWYFAYIYQPESTPQNTSSLKVYSLNKYVTFSYDRINTIEVSSNREVHWMMCDNSYACSLRSPLLKEPQDSGYMFYLLIGLAVLCVVLSITVMILGFIYHRKVVAERLYEKAFWLPRPPPIPERGVLPDNHYLEGHLGEDRIKIQGRENLGHDVDRPEDPRTQVTRNIWTNITEDPRASIIDHESINSIYGLAIR